MIKIEYWGDESCIINSGKLLADTGGIQKIYDTIDKNVTPDRGDPDTVIGKRLLVVLRDGKITLNDYAQSGGETVY